jgi:hypothetical protein
VTAPSAVPQTTGSAGSRMHARGFASRQREDNARRRNLGRKGRAGGTGASRLGGECSPCRMRDEEVVHAKSKRDAVLQQGAGCSTLRRWLLAGHPRFRLLAASDLRSGWLDRHLCRTCPKLINQVRGMDFDEDMIDRSSAIHSGTRQANRTRQWNRRSGRETEAKR